MATKRTGKSNLNAARVIMDSLGPSTKERERLEMSNIQERAELGQKLREIWLRSSDPFPLMADVIFKRETELVKALEAVEKRLNAWRGFMEWQEVDTQTLKQVRAALTAAGRKP